MEVQGDPRRNCLAALVARGQGSKIVLRRCTITGVHPLLHVSGNSLSVCGSMCSQQMLPLTHAGAVQCHGCAAAVRGDTGYWMRTGA
jgi:hypothetical protein